MNLREEFESVKAEASALVEKAKTEKRALTGEEKQEVEKRFARMDEIKSSLADEKKLASYQLEADDSIKEVATKSFTKEKVMDNTNKSASIIDAINHFARTGEKRYEQFVLASGDTSGILMPKSIPGYSVTRQSANAIRRGFAALGVTPFSSSSTENMKLPIFNDGSNTANNDQEASTSAVLADATHSTELDLSLVEYHSKAQFVSKKVAAATDFDISQYIIPAALSRIERKEESDWVSDIITNATVGKTTASTTAFTYAELVTFDESNPVGYEGLPSFYLISSAGRAALRGLGPTSADPIFRDTDGSTRLFGKPLVVCSSLEALTAGKVFMAKVFVDGFDGAVIRDTTANEVVRYVDQPAYPGSVGFEAFGWSAFDWNPAAVRTFKTAAS